MMTERIRRLLKELHQEIQQLVPLREPRDLQWARLEIWAVRYRLLLEEAGPEHGRDPEFGRIHGAIRTKMAGVYPSGKGPFIRALHSGERRNWAVELEEAKARYEKIATRHRLYTETRAKLLELESFLAQGEPASEEERRLHHLIRECAKYENLRGELADMLEPYRKILPAEFGFLFGEGPVDVAPVERPRLSNFDIACRMLRRLLRNHKVGEVYIPIDMITRGFEGADRGRAKEAVALLVRAQVLLLKKEGRTVSLAHDSVRRVERFLAGEPLGVEEVDKWLTG
jgi:hypothetical protein